MNVSRDSLLSVAREMMFAARYCALITVDSTGQPHARAMDPFPPDSNMIVWLGTNAYSRKVREIQNDPRVTLYYADPAGEGYVSIIGEAEPVNDPVKKKIWWKDEWLAFYDDPDKGYILIKVTPKQIDVLSYKHDLIGNRETWRIPSISFEANK